MPTKRPECPAPVLDESGRHYRPCRKQGYAGPGGRYCLRHAEDAERSARMYRVQLAPVGADDYSEESWP